MIIIRGIIVGVNQKLKVRKMKQQSLAAAVYDNWGREPSLVSPLERLDSTLGPQQISPRLQKMIDNEPDQERRRTLGSFLSPEEQQRRVYVGVAKKESIRHGSSAGLGLPDYAPRQTPWGRMYVETDKNDPNLLADTNENRKLFPELFSKTAEAAGHIAMTASLEPQKIRIAEAMTAPVVAEIQGPAPEQRAA